MKKRMLALVLAGVLSCNMGISVMAADDAQAVKESDVVAEITAEEETQTPELPADADDVETPDASEDAAEEEGYTGWDETGDYYYENGEMLTNGVYVIDGIWYMFDYEGRLQRDTYGEFWDEDNLEWREYYADENGQLITGWLQYTDGSYSFYDPEEYYLYKDILFEDEWGDKYYADDEGYLVVSDDVYYDGVLYHADASGRLTEKEAVQSGWLLANGYWYYLVDGEPVTDQIYTIYGEDYFFDADGKMAVGMFWYYDESTGESGSRLADANGHIIKGENTWYAVDGSWYYLKENSWLAYNEFITLYGKTYYFGYDCLMCVGVFDVYDDETGESVYYVADANGVIVSQNKPGWVKAGDDWYYFKEAGVLAGNEFLEIDGRCFFFDWDAKMKAEKFWYDGKYYLPAANGVLSKNQWIKYRGDWYYASDDYSLYEEGIYTIGSEKYLFGWEGFMKKGFATYYDSEGGEVSYLTDDRGVLLEGEGWKYYNLNYYYSNADGSLKRNEWIGDHYFVGYNCKMAVGTYYIDDEIYYFDNSGYCKENISAQHPAGWKLIDGYWYYYDESGMPYTGVLDGTYYIMNGEMLTDTFVEAEDEYGDSVFFYFGYDGKVVRNGWHKAVHDYGDEYYGYSWIYADADGILVEDGWKQIGKNRYYFQGCEAAMGAVEIDGETELFDSSCAWIPGDYKGWQYVDGDWYYFKPDGTMIQDQETAVIDGNTFYFWYGGMLKTDMVETDYETKDMFYLDASGYRHRFTGWKKAGNTWYYADANGKAVTGLKNIGGSYYMFSYNGAMETGYQYVEEWDGSYFFGASGAYQSVWNGWVSDGYSWYYFVNGEPVEGKITVINGQTYAFSYGGQMITGPYMGYVFSNSGALARNAWYQTPLGGWYYADASGRYVYGQRTIDGRTYWFSNYGRLIK